MRNFGIERLLRCSIIRDLAATIHAKQEGANHFCRPPLVKIQLALRLRPDHVSSGLPSPRPKIATVYRS